jgi:hypothetical protein
MTELPHGRTVEEVARIARHIAFSQRGRILDLDEATDIAAVALVERCYADPAPTDVDLFRAARSAVSAANQHEYSYAGLEQHVARKGREGTPHEWARYWHGQTALVSPFEEELTDRLAVRQVVAALPPRHREALVALAEQGSYEGARTALGLSVKGWEHRIARARVQARALWYHPEEPAGLWGGRDRPGRGPDPRGRNRGLLHLARMRWPSTKKGEPAA